MELHVNTTFFDIMRCFFFQNFDSSQNSANRMHELRIELRIRSSESKNSSFVRCLLIICKGFCIKSTFPFWNWNGFQPFKLPSVKICPHKKKTVEYNINNRFNSNCLSHLCAWEYKSKDKYKQKQAVPFTPRLFRF